MIALRADLKVVVDAYSALKKAEKELDEEKQRLATVLLTPPQQAGRFAVTEKLVWGGILVFYGVAKELEAEDAKKDWIWGPGGLQSGALTPSSQPPPPPADSPAEAPPS